MSSITADQFRQLFNESEAAQCLPPAMREMAFRHALRRFIEEHPGHICVKQKMELEVSEGEQPQAVTVERVDPYQIRLSLSDQGHTWSVVLDRRFADKACMALTRCARGEPVSKGKLTALFPDCKITLTREGFSLLRDETGGHWSWETMEQALQTTPILFHSLQEQLEAQTEMTEEGLQTVLTSDTARLTFRCPVTPRNLFHATDAVKRREQVVHLQLAEGLRIVEELSSIVLRDDQQVWAVFCPAEIKQICVGLRDQMAHTLYDLPLPLPEESEDEE